MRRAHPIEREIGIGHYASDVPGTGGRLRARPSDFRVRELEGIVPEPVDADPDAYSYLVLRVRLTAWDTNDFAAALTDRLGVSRERVDWAGTKDKRAETTQLFTLRAPDIDADRIPSLKDASIETIGRLGRALRYGDLHGNSFQIVVRDAERAEQAAAVTAALRVEPASDGAIAVPNYFGHQRFGSRRTITHEVGLAILRGEWRDAVLAYIGSPSDREPADARDARRIVEEEASSASPDWRRALSAMPARLGYERAILHTLGESQRSQGGMAPYRDALDALPANLQQLFVHAAQSYIFNRIVSTRFERGLSLTTPAVGDVACFVETVEYAAPTGSERRSLVVPDMDRTQRIDASRRDTVARHCRRGRAFITGPLVGTDTSFANGEPGDIERSVCEAVGVERSAFDLPEPYGTSGTRRAIAVRTALSVDGVDGEDRYELEFALPKGSYATIIAREYLKESPEAL